MMGQSRENIASRSVRTAAFSVLIAWNPLACSSSNEATKPDVLDSSGAGGSRESQGSEGTAGSGETSFGGAAAFSTTYPEGPYGEGNPRVGETIEALAWEGYLRLGDDTLVASGELQATSLAELRLAGASVALIHTATTWCSSCRAAADDLARRGDELSNQGALIIELLLEGQSYITPDDEELTAWVKTSDLTVTTVRGADARTEAVFPSREYVYIVELESMKVVWAKQALYSSPSITEEGVKALLDYL